MAPPRTVPREILKWIQSLDLSYSIKDSKRDLFDGFLIAEIFSRYSSLFHYKIQMPSYDHTHNSVRIKNNWHQLAKFFRKNDVPFLEEDFEDIPKKDF